MSTQQTNTYNLVTNFTQYALDTLRYAALGLVNDKPLNKLSSTEENRCISELLRIYRADSTFALALHILRDIGTAALELSIDEVDELIFANYAQEGGVF